MAPDQKVLETLALQQNAVDYWYCVDIKGGDGVSEMFVEDGVFHAGPGKPLVGRDAIQQFYNWRQDRGQRTSRHVITNFHAEFDDDTHATTSCVMMLLASDGVPIHPTAPPIFIGDQIDRCVKGDDGKWRYKERRFNALFLGGEAPTVPPEEITASGGDKN